MEMPRNPQVVIECLVRRCIQVHSPNILLQSFLSYTCSTTGGRSLILPLDLLLIKAVSFPLKQEELVFENLQIIPVLQSRDYLSGPGYLHRPSINYQQRHLPAMFAAAAPLDPR